MRYYFDTEFIEDGKTIDLISIGIVAEDGRELYLLNCDCDWSKASQWVKDNVLAKLPAKPNLEGYYSPFPKWLESEPYKQGWRTSKHSISSDVLAFCDPLRYGNPEFWAAWAAYDWVAFCQLFGTMMDLPAGYPYYCRDVIQWADQLGVGREALPSSPDDEHNALADARWVRDAWQVLDKLTN